MSKVQLWFMVVPTVLWFFVGPSIIRERMRSAERAGEADALPFEHPARAPGNMGTLEVEWSDAGEVVPTHSVP